MYSMEDSEMTQQPANLGTILIALVDELENLRASQAVLAQFGSVPTNPEIVRIAKDRALKDEAGHYDILRQSIRGLAL